MGDVAVGRRRSGIRDAGLGRALRIADLGRNFELPDWNEGERLTHKIGIYIADRKTPVAVARRIASALADSAKQGIGGANVAQIMVTESAAPPMDVTNIGPEILARYRCDISDAAIPRTSRSVSISSAASWKA